MADELPPPVGRPADLPAPEGAPSGPAEAQVWGGRTGRSLPSWKVLAGAAGALVVVIGGLAIAAGGGGGGGRNCTKDLLAHFERGRELGNLLVATDLDRARDHGYEDGGSLEDLGSSQRSTGTYPGLLAQRFRFAQLYNAEDFAARTGVGAQSVSCAVGNLAFEVSSGSFDPPEVRGSAAGDDGLLAASDDRLAMAGGAVDSPSRLLEPLERGSLAQDDHVVATVDRLLGVDAYSYVVQLAEGEPGDDAPRVAGVGIAEGEGEDDDRVLWVVWVFANDDAATAGRPAMARHLAGVYEGIATIAADGLSADGRVVSGSFPIREPARWFEAEMRDEGFLPSSG